MNYNEINCDSRTVYRCDWYNTSDCKHTCNFAEERDNTGIGAMCVEDVGRLELEVNKDEQFSK